MSYIILFFGIVDSYLLVRILEPGQQIIQASMAALILLILGGIVWAKRKRKSDEKAVIGGILLMGIVMRVGYMLYTGCDVRSHDLWEFNLESGGHAGYLLTIILEGRLPETNFRQYYQQPFFYIVGGMVSRGINGLLKSDDWYYLVDAAKTVSCFASCACLLVLERICTILEIEGKGKRTALALTAFLPVFYLTGGRVNCDSLNALFILLAFLYTIRWSREPSWKNVIILAFVYGFGMMNKISCGVMAVFTAAVFIWMFWKADRNWRDMLKKYLVFAFISFPLGLWYSVRNLLKFGQGLTYVLRIPETSEIYCGSYSIVQRFLSWDIGNLLKTPYADVWKDYNCPVYFIKSALFGEFTYEINDVIPVILLGSLVFLVLLLTAALICNIWKRRGKWELSAFCLIYISALLFAYQYPFGCSMDFRYLGAMGGLGALILGRYYNHAPRPWIRTAIDWNTAVFSLFSCLMFILIK